MRRRLCQKVETAAQKIADHRKESRIILLSGPSGSGKTTTALKIEEQLEKMGIQTHTISMDNYFNTMTRRRRPGTGRAPSTTSLPSASTSSC